MEATAQNDSLPVRASKVLRRLGLGLTDNSSELIDWREVAGVAMDVVGDDRAGSHIPEAVSEEFAAYVAEIAPLVAEFTGLTPADPIKTPVVFNRAEWIAVTAQFMKPLIEPFVEEIAGPRYGRSRFLKAGLWGELGFVLGYLSRRVLGQYNISFTESSDHDGLIYFIYPNIVETEDRLGVEGGEFRRWLALHEVTHAFEFQANPWVRDYVRELITSQMVFLRDRLEGLESSGDGESPLPAPVKGLLAPGSWRDVMSLDENPGLAKTQALMSVLEGYSEFVMGRVGARSNGEINIAEMFETARGSKPIANKLIERLIGLQVKTDQYRLGHRFIEQAAVSTDMELVNRLWEGPKNIPTLTELEAPELWIKRMLK